MTPERKEEIKKVLSACDDHPWMSSGSNLKLHASCFDYVSELMAALEEAEQRAEKHRGKSRKQTYCS